MKIYKIWLSVMTIVVGLAFSAETTNGQTMEDSIAQASEHAEWVNKIIRERIKNFASPKTHSVLSRTAFTVNRNTSIPTAYANRDFAGRQRIIISSQLVLAFFYIAELNQFQFSNNEAWEKCGLAYQYYMRLSYKKMMSDSLAGRKSVPLRPPESYAVEYGGPCDGLEKHYPFPENLKPRRNKSVNTAIATVYLHELAHHVNGDVSRSKKGVDLSDPKSMRRYLKLMCYSRQQELRADRFAAYMLVDLGWGDSVFDQTFTGTLIGLGDIDPDIERSNTHPSPSRRMALFLDAGRARLKAKGVPFSSKLSNLIDQTIHLQKKIEFLLPLSPIPGSEGVVCP